MTDPDPFDELASAYLDGATSPEETARVADHPELLARVEELRAVQDALRELPPVDATRRDAAIAAALSAYEDVRSDDDASSEPLAAVAPLAARRGISPRAVRVLSAAAVVAILALLVPLLANLSNSDDETATFQSTGAAISGTHDASTDGAEAAAPTQASGDAAGGADDSAARDFGAFADLDALAAAVAAADLEPRSTPSTLGNDKGSSQPSFSDCALPESAGTSVVAVAVVAGEPVTVVVRTASDGARTLTVLRSGSCEVLDQRQL